MDARLATLETLEQEGPEAPFEMTNLYPKTTGLPMTIWISPRGRARHDIRVKVCQVHGRRMDPDNLAMMSVRPEPQLLHGELPAADVELVSRWIKANEALLIEIWDGEVDPVEEAARFQKV